MFIVVAYFITCVVAGNPIERFKFSNNVKEYLQETYPAMDWSIVSIDYDFKVGEFLATVKDDASIPFLVYSNDDNRLYDNYVTSVWVNEIKTAATKKAEEVFGLDVEVVVNIVANGKDLIENANNIPEYGEVSKSLAPDTTVAFIADFSEKELYGKCLEIVNWLVYKKYFADVSFFSEDDKLYVSIPPSEIEKIRNEGDIKKYR